MKTLLGRLHSISISKNRGSKISKKAELLFNKFVKQVDKIFKNLPKSLEWQSFYVNDLPLLMDICKEVQEVSIQHRPWPRPLAQTWHAKTEFFSFHFLSISGVTEFSKQVAPGQALAQTWFMRVRCMSLKSRIMQRWHYVHIASRQGRLICKA